ncbi:MAG: tetratricopeptide repeat protein [Prevotella sp.]|nr:tetratricopeptide repeat protein [Prevotella sp.]
MEITALINHPEQMDRDTLYELRSTLALHPYFQTARLLMLQNLYLLHDPSFDEELRRAALYVTDRKVIFQMIEAAHYQLRTSTPQNSAPKPQSSRTVALIDTFLDSIPAEDEKPRRKPTPADAAVDYVAYLLESEPESPAAETPQMKGQDLIDTFLEQEKGHIVLSELTAELTPSQQPDSDGEEDIEEEYFTETLARIYIRQGRYQRALDIIGRLNSQFPHKNAYFADQMRFLEKLIINSNKNKN